MKTPDDLENEVMEKYLPIVKKRAEDYLEQLEKRMEERKEEYYLNKRIGIGETLENLSTDEDLTKEEQNSEEKSKIKAVINTLAWKYIREKLDEANWKIAIINKCYYLVRIRE